MRRKAGFVAEGAKKMCFAHSRCRRQLLERDGLRPYLVEVVEDKCQTAFRQECGRGTTRTADVKNADQRSDRFVLDKRVTDRGRQVMPYLVQTSRKLGRKDRARQRIGDDRIVRPENVLRDGDGQHRGARLSTNGPADAWSPDEHRTSPAFVSRERSIDLDVDRRAAAHVELENIVFGSDDRVVAARSFDPQCGEALARALKTCCPHRRIEPVQMPCPQVRVIGPDDRCYRPRGSLCAVFAREVRDAHLTINEGGFGIRQSKGGL